MEDGTTPTRSGENNLRQTQSEGGAECDENNQTGNQAKPRAEQVEYLTGKQLPGKIFMYTGSLYLDLMTLSFLLHNHLSMHA